MEEDSDDVIWPQDRKCNRINLLNETQNSYYSPIIIIIIIIIIILTYLLTPWP
jgi:hypothetical protein